MKTVDDHWNDGKKQIDYFSLNATLQILILPVWPLGVMQFPQYKNSMYSNITLMRSTIFFKHKWTNKQTTKKIHIYYLTNRFCIWWKMMLSVCLIDRIVSSIDVSFVSFNIGMLNSRRERDKVENGNVGAQRIE